MKVGNQSTRSPRNPGRLRPIADDPNLTDTKFPGNPTQSYRTLEPLRVTGECTGWQGHPPEIVQAMKDRIKDLEPLDGS